MLQALVELTSTDLEAERSSLFLNDPVTNKLYSRVAQGNALGEIRVQNSSGVVGHVFTSGESLIIHIAANDGYPSGNRRWYSSMSCST